MMDTTDRSLLMQTKALQNQVLTLREAIALLIRWHGKRDNFGADELLPADKQPMEIAHAMKVLDETGGAL